MKNLIASLKVTIPKAIKQEAVLQLLHTGATHILGTHKKSVLRVSIQKTVKTATLVIYFVPGEMKSQVEEMMAGQKFALDNMLPEHKGLGSAVEIAEEVEAYGQIF